MNKIWWHKKKRRKISQKNWWRHLWTAPNCTSDTCVSVCPTLKTKVGQLSRIAEFLFLNPIRNKVLFTLCATLMSLNLVEKVNKLGRGYSISVGNIFLGKMAEFDLKWNVLKWNVLEYHLQRMIAGELGNSNLIGNKLLFYCNQGCWNR